MAPPTAPGAVEVLKSPADKKEYRFLRLDNGMAVLLIHDPEIGAILEAQAAAKAGGKVRSREEQVIRGALRYVQGFRT